MVRTKARTRSALAVARDKKLDAIRLQAKGLHARLLELSKSMNGFHVPVDKEAWPYADDPEVHVAVMKRLVGLAEAVHAIPFVIEHLKDYDTRPLRDHARQIVNRSGGNYTDGWYAPDKDSAARTKERLIELVTQSCATAQDPEARKAALIGALTKWFSTEAAGDPGARALTAGLDRAWYPTDRARRLADAIEKVSLDAPVDGEAIIKAVWKSLGAKPKFLDNLFSYKNQRAKRGARRKIASES